MKSFGITKSPHCLATIRAQSWFSLLANRWARMESLVNRICGPICLCLALDTTRFTVWHASWLAAMWRNPKTHPRSVSVCFRSKIEHLTNFVSSLDPQRPSFMGDLSDDLCFFQSAHLSHGSKYAFITCLVGVIPKVYLIRFVDSTTKRTNHSTDIIDGKYSHRFISYLSSRNHSVWGESRTGNIDRNQDDSKCGELHHYTRVEPKCCQV